MEKTLATTAGKVIHFSVLSELPDRLSCRVRTPWGRLGYQVIKLPSNLCVRVNALANVRPQGSELRLELPRFGSNFGTLKSNFGTSRPVPCRTSIPPAENADIQRDRPFCHRHYSSENRTSAPGGTFFSHNLSTSLKDSQQARTATSQIDPISRHPENPIFSPKT
jgi:hypothetical protein